MMPGMSRFNNLDGYPLTGFDQDAMGLDGASMAVGARGKPRITVNLEDAVLEEQKLY